MANDMIKKTFYKLIQVSAVWLNIGVLFAITPALDVELNDLPGNLHVGEWTQAISSNQVSKSIYVTNNTFYINGAGYSISSAVLSVNSYTGAVVLTGADIAVSGTDETTVDAALAGKRDYTDLTIDGAYRLPLSALPITGGESTLGFDWSSYSIIKEYHGLTLCDAKGQIAASFYGDPIAFQGGASELRFNGSEGVSGSWPVLEQDTLAKTSETSGALAYHAGNTTIHVTSEDKTRWDGKRDYDDRTYPQYTLPPSALPITGGESTYGFNWSSYSLSNLDSGVALCDADGRIAASFSRETLRFTGGVPELRFNGAEGVPGSFPVAVQDTLALSSFVAAAARDGSNNVTRSISATSPAFSNAVLSVGLGVDTNSLAAINALLDAGDTPLGTATTIGAILAALAAAIAGLRKLVLNMTGASIAVSKSDPTKVDAALAGKRDLDELGVRGAPNKGEGYFIVDGVTYIWDDVFPVQWVDPDARDRRVMILESGHYMLNDDVGGIDFYITAGGNYTTSVDISGTTHVVYGYVDSLALSSEIPDVAALNDKIDETALLRKYYPIGNVTSLSQITTTGLEYTYDDETHTATLSNGLNATGDVVIPYNVEHNGAMYKVTEVGTEAFSYYGGEGYISANITSLVAPTTVIRIRDVAFSSCTTLTSVLLPSVTRIESNGAFASCTNLASVSLPSATDIGGYAFDSCTNLASVDFGTTPRTISLAIDVFASVPTSCIILLPMGAYDADWQSLKTAGYDVRCYANVSDIPDVPTNVSAFTNDSGYITSAALPYAIKMKVPSEDGVLTLADRTVNVAEMTATAARETCTWSDGGDYGEPSWNSEYSYWVPPTALLDHLQESSCSAYSLVPDENSVNVTFTIVSTDSGDPVGSITAMRPTASSQSVSSIKMPSKTSRWTARDFVLRLTIALEEGMTEVPSVSYTGEEGLVFETDSGSLPTLVAGVNLLAFTETGDGKMLVAHKEPKEVS